MRTRDLIAELDGGWAALEATRPRVEAGVPWPVSQQFDTAPEAHWYPPEVLAHVSELVERWHGVVTTILAGDREPVPFGTPGPSPSRLVGIERNRHLPMDALYGLIERHVMALRATLAGMSDADLEKRGVHPTRGESSIGEIVHDSITGHMDEHVRQLESLLADAGR
jgi:hypothetical protein